MNQNSMAYHRPVLLNESIEGLNINPKGIYVDLTFGGGGHSLKILEKLGRNGRLYAFDQDPDARQNIPTDKRLTFIQTNFRYLRNFLRFYDVSGVDGILADLGISSYQIDQPERGFSFRTESNLDMRMNPDSPKSAQDVLNEYSEDELHRVFREYGELKGIGRAVNALVTARKTERIVTSGQLEAILGGMVPVNNRSKFLARVYQAIRIEVNGEIDALKEMLVQTSGLMNEGGRLAVITYHSLEDRLVKNYIKSGNLEGDVKKDFFGKPMSVWTMVNRKVITPGEDELRENSRSRSAKLRIAEKI